MSGKNAKSGKGGNTIAKVHDMVMPIIDELGLSLWDIVFEKEGAYWYLRVFIDGKDDLASMEDCENVTRPLSKLLDEQDPYRTELYPRGRFAGDRTCAQKGGAFPKVPRMSDKSSLYP